MKNIFIAAIILIATTNAFAVDRSQYSGPYVGLTVGYVKGDLKGHEESNGAPDGIVLENTSPGKFIYGGLLGYNKSLNNNFVLGVEADFERRNIKNTANLLNPSGFSFGDTLETKIQNAYSARLRVGKVFNNDKSMIYFTGGYAAIDIARNYFLNGSTISQSKWQGGYTAGLGIEHFINDVISVKTEYRYSDYGKNSLEAGLLGLVERSKYENEQSIRLGLMYHF